MVQAIESPFDSKRVFRLLYMSIKGKLVILSLFREWIIRKKQRFLQSVLFLSPLLRKSYGFFLDFNVFIFMKFVNVSIKWWMIRDGHCFIWRWVNGGWKEGRGRNLSRGGVGSLLGLDISILHIYILMFTLCFSYVIYLAYYLRVKLG